MSDNKPRETPSNALLLKRIAELESILQDARREQRHLRKIIDLHGTAEAKRMAAAQRIY